MSNIHKFELLIKEPWVCEDLDPPEDPLGELTELENSLQMFCYECNHRIVLKIGEEKEELFLDPDIILDLQYLPEQMRALSLGKRVDIDFPESWLMMKFMPEGELINCTLREFGNSCTTKEFQLDKAQVLEAFDSFLEELMEMAIARGYITHEQKNQVLKGMAYV